MRSSRFFAEWDIVCRSFSVASCSMSMSAVSVMPAFSAIFAADSRDSALTVWVAGVPALSNPSSRQSLVRVMVNESVDPPVVVTVYRTNKIAKYWRKP